MSERGAVFRQEPGAARPEYFIADSPVAGREIRIEDDHGDPLTTVIGEIVRDFAADGLVITHEGHGDAPVTLFSGGSWEVPGTGFEHALIESADGDRAEWQHVEGAPGSGIWTMHTPTRAGLITVRALFRRMNDKTRARARVASSRLQPLLGPLARLWWQRREVGSTLRSLKAAIDKADVGIILIDANGQPAFTNIAARLLLDQRDGLRIAAGRLSGNALADTLRLQAACDHVLAGGDCSRGSPIITMPRRERRPLMVAVMPVDADADGAADAEHAVILYVFDPEQDLCSVIEPACHVYCLSPVETRLTCLLANGSSLAEAAAKMRVREMTARSYLKQIFLKTQTNRQAELVWLMLKSTVRARTAAAA